MKYLLDTHTWIWWNMIPGNLSEKIIKLLSNINNYEELLLSAISPWEFCKLLEKERLAITCDPEEWIRKAVDMPKLRFVPLSPIISYKSTVLPRPFHDDPANQIIAATAREENATVLTKDSLLRKYKHIKCLW